MHVVDIGKWQGKQGINRNKDRLFLNRASRENMGVLGHRSLLLGSLLPEGHVWASIEGERVL